MTTTAKNEISEGTLYLVATPIGNLSDLSERAVKVLEGVSFIAAEDTRNTGKLLSRFGIQKELLSYHEHNKAGMGETIAKRLLQGESCALVTDAGTPAISDPGEDLVRLCASRSIQVTSVPGPCAAINALTLSALPTRRFVFEGFLPTERSEREDRLRELSFETRTMILHEAPHRLLETLSDLSNALGEDRRISLCREMTKLNEEIIRTDIMHAIEHFGTQQPRGEFVLVIEGKKPENETSPLLSMSIEDHVSFYINTGMDRKEAIKAVAKDRHVAKNEIYMVFTNQEDRKE